MTDAGSRADFDSLIPWARRQYTAGRGPADVMRAIYGVDLPPEFYLLARIEEEDLDLPYNLMVHPWQLLVAADPATTPYTGDRWARRQEEHAFAQHPDFLPLLRLSSAAGGRYNRHIIGYDLAALRVGTTRVLGHWRDIPATGAELRPVGDSVLGVMHVWATTGVDVRRAQLDDPKNFGFGSVDEQDLEEAAELVRQIEALRRRSLEGPGSQR